MTRFFLKKLKYKTATTSCLVFLLNLFAKLIAQKLFLDLLVCVCVFGVMCIPAIVVIVPSAV